MSGNSDPPESGHEPDEDNVQNQDDLTVITLLDRIAKTTLIIITKVLDIVASVIGPITVLVLVSVINDITVIPTLIIQVQGESYALPAMWLLSAVAVAITISRLLRILLNTDPELVAQDLFDEGSGEKEDEQTTVERTERGDSNK